MSIAYDQTRALVWKCWILRIRHRWMTFIECVFPLIMLVAFVLVVAQLSGHQPHEQTNYGQQMPSQNFSNPEATISETLLRFALMRNTLLYMPDHVCSARLLRRVRLMLHLRTGCPWSQMKTLPEREEDSLIDKFYAFGRKEGDEQTSAVNILGSCNSWSDFILGQMQFQLYTRGNAKSQAFPKKSYAGPFDYNLYLPPYSPFVELLVLMNDARLLSAFEMNLDPKLVDDRWKNSTSESDGQLILDWMISELDKTNPFASSASSQAPNDGSSNESTYQLSDLVLNRLDNSLATILFNLSDRQSSGTDDTNPDANRQVLIDLINEHLLNEVRERVRSLDFRKSLSGYVNEHYWKKVTNQINTSTLTVEELADSTLSVSLLDISRIRNRIRELSALLNDHQKLRLLNVSLVSAYPELVNMRIPLPLHDIEINQFVYPSYIERPPPLITDTLPYVVVFGFIVSLPLLMKSITEEKQRGLRELFRLMGLTQKAYISSIVIGYIPVMLFHSIVLSLLIRVSILSGSAVFPHCSITLLFAIFMSYSVSSILFTLCISVPFNRPVLSLICSALAHIITTLPDYLLEPGLVGNSTLVCFFRVLSCLLPNMALNYCLRLISAKELYSQAQGWLNLFDMDFHYQALSIGVILAVQLWSCIFYLFLYWYLDNVWPWQDGVPKSPLFIFSPRFWKSFQSFHEKPNTNFCEAPAMPPLRNQGQYYEAQPAVQSYAFQLRNLRKDYGVGANRRVAIQNLNLDLPDGELCVLLGHNGAGKSTLMKLITGVAVPTFGQVMINGFDMQNDTFQARASISFCPQYNALYDELSALEHMWLFGALRTASVSATLDSKAAHDSESFVSAPEMGAQEHVKLLMQLSLFEKAKLPTSGYSGGQKRKLCLAIALLGDPRLVILDEPTSGMDPEARRSVVEVLLRHRRRRAILLTTHFLEEADAVADRICIMSTGQVKCFGSPTFLRAKFGAGYKLRIAKSLQFQPKHRNELLALLARHFPRGEIGQESVGEIIFALDPGAAECEDEEREDGNVRPTHDQGQMAQFFAHFEPRRSQMQVSSCGLSVTTLEDVFLRVVTMDSPIPSSLNPDGANSSVSDWSEAASQSDPSEPIDSVDQSDANDSLSWSLAIGNFESVKLTSKANTVSTLPIVTPSYRLSNKKSSKMLALSPDHQAETFELLTGWPLQLVRLKALVVKRLNFSKRYYPMICFQLLLPLAMFMLLFGLDSFLRQKMTESQRFELRSNQLYGSTEGFLQMSEQVKHRLNWRRLQDSFNQTFIEERVQMRVLESHEHPQQYQRELTEKLSIDQYISRHLYGFSLYMANEPRLALDKDKSERKSFLTQARWLAEQQERKESRKTTSNPRTTTEAPPDQLVEPEPIMNDASDNWITSSLDPHQLDQASKLSNQASTGSSSSSSATAAADPTPVDPTPEVFDASSSQPNTRPLDAGGSLQWHEIEELLRARRSGLGAEHGMSDDDLALLGAIHNITHDLSLYVQVWHNNEALHALPLAMQMLYQSLFRWFNVTNHGQPIHVHSWNRPMRSQFEYLLILDFMHLFKIVWGILGSIAFSFLSASYVLQPAAERASRAKLLQHMTGTPLWLYWLAHSLFDLTIHVGLSLGLVALFQTMDSKNLFAGHPESMGSLFALLILFGACMMPICYCVSLYVRSSSSAFSATLGFNLIGGVFLTLVDYIIDSLRYRHIVSPATLDILLTVFRMFPLFSLTKAISKLYELGSNAGACRYFSQSFLENNCVSKQVPFVGCCKRKYLSLLS
jgi:ABC-type multidrug transport system ATPase subunit